MITKDNLNETVSCSEPKEQEKNPEIRVDKVRQVRLKLKAKQYHPDDYLDIALDRMLEAILTQNSEKPEHVSG